MKFHEPGLALLLTGIILAGLAAFLRALFGPSDRWQDPPADDHYDHLFD